MSRIACVVFATVCANTLICLEAKGQATPTENRVQVGSRIRVMNRLVDSEKLVGTLVRADSNTLVLARRTEADTIVLKSANISLVERSTGTYRPIGKGVGIGAITGALAGALAGFAACEASTSTCGTEFDEGWTNAFVAGGGMVGALVGMVVGAGVASNYRVDSWERVNINTLRVGAGRTSRGTTLSLTYSF